MTNVILASEFVTDTMALILRIEKHRKLTYKSYLSLHSPTRA